MTTGQRQLIHVLRAKQDGVPLADRLAVIRKVASEKLEHSWSLFPQYTDHTIQHSDGVVDILNWIVPDNVKDDLNAHELYFLIAAAYLHDIGMVEGCPGSPSGPAWEAFYNQYRDARPDRTASDVSGVETDAKRLFVRDQHHRRSEEYIVQSWRELELRAFDIAAEGQIVGRLALGHRKVDLGDQTAYSDMYFTSNNVLVRRSLLAAYLRLADELDTSAYRTPWAEFEVLDIDDPVSIQEWGKHLAISGVGPSGNRIIISGRCSDFDIYLRLLRLQEEIQDKLNELRHFISNPYIGRDQSQIYNPLPFEHVDLDIETVGFKRLIVRFNLSHEDIVYLLSSDRLYGDKNSWIRELLQNAVDTCREASDLRPASWKASIRISVDLASNTIEVADNGMGMDQRIIETYFARLGRSYYRSADFRGTFEPASEFGIGILSCFSVAARVEVETLREGGEPIHLDLADLSKPFLIRDGSRSDPGTTIRMHISPGSWDLNGIETQVRAYARHIEIPISIQIGGKLIEVVDQGMLPQVREAQMRIYNRVSFEDKPEPTESQLEESLKMFHAEAVRDGMRVGVTLLTEALHNASEGTVPLAWQTEPDGRISQNGFLVTNLTTAFGETGKGLWCEVDLRSQARRSLTLDRTRFVGNAHDLAGQFRELVSECLETVYQRSYASSGSSQWWRYHLTHYQREISPIPSALQKHLETNAQYCVLFNGQFATLGRNEIERFAAPKYWIPAPGHDEVLPLATLLPSDVLAVIRPAVWNADDSGLAPTWSGSFWSVGWPLRGLGLRSNGLVELLKQGGAQFFKASIAGKERPFIDAGKPLGEWILRGGWIKELFEPHEFRPTIFDAQNPVSRLLLALTDETLPPASRLVVNAVLDEAIFWHGQDLTDQVNGMLATLKSDGVIDTVTECGWMPNEAYPPHQCPYGGSHHSGNYDDDDL